MMKLLKTRAEKRRKPVTAVAECLDFTVVYLFYTVTNAPCPLSFFHDALFNLLRNDRCPQASELSSNL